jgi:hypothetical protein
LAAKRWRNTDIDEFSFRGFIYQDILFLDVGKRDEMMKYAIAQQVFFLDKVYTTSGQRMLE